MRNLARVVWRRNVHDGIVTGRLTKQGGGIEHAWDCFSKITFLSAWYHFKKITFFEYQVSF